MSLVNAYSGIHYFSVTTMIDLYESAGFNAVLGDRACSPHREDLHTLLRRVSVTFLIVYVKFMFNSIETPRQLTQTTVVVVNISMLLNVCCMSHWG